MQKFLVPSKTMSAYVANTSALSIEVSSAKNVELKSPYQKFVVIEWVILN